LSGSNGLTRICSDLHTGHVLYFSYDPRQSVKSAWSVFSWYVKNMKTAEHQKGYCLRQMVRRLDWLIMIKF